jgi:anaerobic nitric oxide reductase transcription regulator
MSNTREQYNLDSDDSPIKAIIGESEIIKSIKAEIKLVAPTDAQVLITGETGVGKNLIAKVIHELHPRRRKYKFRRTNVGALVPELAASQLFGHVRGAFTGAERTQEGIIVEADKGTLFLDEISTAPSNVQIMLLTLSEVNRINPVGGDKSDSKEIDIRILSATSLTPKKLLHMRSFRQELFFRLAEYIIEVPPLRERREDIPLLARYFMQKANEKIRLAGNQGFIPLVEISEDARNKLCHEYDWPGNVRELEHVIRAAVVRSRKHSPKNTVLHQDWIDFPSYATDSPENPLEIELDGEVGLHEHVSRFRYHLCMQALHKTGGNKTKAAKELLKIDFDTLQKYLNYKS